MNSDMSSCWIFFFASCLDIYTCEQGMLSCHQEKRRILIWKNLIVTLCRQKWRHEGCGKGESDLEIVLSFRKMIRQNPSPSQSTAGMSLVCCLYSSTKGFALGSQVAQEGYIGLNPCISASSPPCHPENYMTCHFLSASSLLWEHWGK